MLLCFWFIIPTGFMLKENEVDNKNEQIDDRCPML